MRRIINKKTAIEVIIMLLALICIMTIWPVRVFTDIVYTEPKGELTGEVGTVSFEDAYTQEFITRYKRLSSVDVMVN